MTQMSCSYFTRDLYDIFGDFLRIATFSHFMRQEMKFLGVHCDVAERERGEGEGAGGGRGICAYLLRKSAGTSRKRSAVFATNEPPARL